MTPARQVRETSTGYVAKLRKDGLAFARADLERRAVLRAERRERELARRAELKRQLDTELRLHLVPLRKMGRAVE